MKKLDAMEKQTLLRSINDVINELSDIREVFENASDPKLIDYAIYMEEALKSKYTYLLSEAKSKGIKVEVTDNVRKVEVS
ncbi:YaaL family protein [Clostridium oceanicum]|uniref:YaaL family protein n=2 Tax=Clostridium oceanicum TaxID=1543 RepID=A0ABP3UIQ5_9CLOT